MSKIAFVFPGQGAQAVGMGQDVYDKYDQAKAIFSEADEVLGFSLTDIIFNGPDEQLKQTRYTQPALLTTSIALYEVFKATGMKPDFVAGHSLGEYSALVVSGVLSFADAVRIVHQRGLFMEEAGSDANGGMAAVLGADREALEKLCRNIAEQGQIIEPANVNCPGQIVVSGTLEGIEQVSERAKEAGAKRVIPLEVSGPFHSSFMRPAAEKLGEVLADVVLNDASVPVVANVTAQSVTEGDIIRQLLVDQVVSPVLWEDSIRYMIGEDVNTFVEIGSGRVLTGLIRKIDRTVKTVSIQNVDDLQNALDRCLDES